MASDKDISYQRMEKAKLIELIKELQANDLSRKLAGTVAELQTHQAELEAQNDALRELQQELEDSRNRYASLYDFAPIPYLTLDRRGNVIEANLTASTLLGVERSSFIGYPLSRFLRPGQVATLSAHLNRCAKEPLRCPDLTLVLEDDSEIPVEIVSQAEGQGDRIRCAILDLSDRKRAEEERAHAQAEEARRASAEEADRMKDNFLATLSHELRTPLNTIQSWMYAMRTGRLGKVETEEGLEVIQRCVQAQTQLIDDLLDVSRITRGQLRIEMEPLDLRTVVQTAAESVGIFAGQKQLKLRVRDDPAPCVVNGNAMRLQQIIWNLLTNAIKFTPAGGCIDIGIERRPGGNAERAIVQVRDDGIGIGAESLPHIFERFWQADSSTTRSRGGLGLGLAIVRHLTELHGGTVSASSEGQGQGATFSVSLPLLKEGVVPPPAPRQEAALPAAQEPGRRDLKGLRVLVVEDDRATRDILAKLLEDGGAKVIKASSSAEAMAAFKPAPPDLLVCDIGLPGQDGLTLIRRIRSHTLQANRKVPAIALTAYAGHANEKRALEAGFEAFLTKPIELGRLTETISRLVGRS